GHDGFLPMRFTAEIGAAFALLLSCVVAGVHVHDLLLKKLLNRLLNLNLVRTWPNPENVLVLLLAQKRGLFCERRRFNDVEGLVHRVLSLSSSIAASVTKFCS